MFPWLIPNAVPAQAGTGGQLSLLQMMMGPPQGGLFNSRSPFEPAPVPASAGMNSAGGGDRSDQTRRGNQPDTGNTMAPPGQNPPGGPDDPQSQPAMSDYDYNTVSPGWGAPSWMQTLVPASAGMNSAGVGGPRLRGDKLDNPRQQQMQRGGMQMGLLGLSMLQPRQPVRTGPYPWI